MASSLFHRAWKPFQRLAWKPLVFPKQGRVSIPVKEKVEEETLPGYAAGRYYPARIGQTFQDRYQVVGKLGNGTTSTVWLARDLE
jgi:serine/threonine-protein kinase SRPK3